MRRKREAFNHCNYYSIIHITHNLCLIFFILNYIIYKFLSINLRWFVLANIKIVIAISLPYKNSFYYFLDFKYSRHLISVYIILSFPLYRYCQFLKHTENLKLLSILLKPLSAFLVILWAMFNSFECLRGWENQK